MHAQLVSQHEFVLIVMAIALSAFALHTAFLVLRKLFRMFGEWLCGRWGIRHYIAMRHWTKAKKRRARVRPKPRLAATTTPKLKPEPKAPTPKKKTPARERADFITNIEQMRAIPLPLQQERRLPEIDLAAEREANPIGKAPPRKPTYADMGHQMGFQGAERWRPPGDTKSSHHISTHETAYQSGRQERFDAIRRGEDVPGGILPHERERFQRPEPPAEILDMFGVGSFNDNEQADTAVVDINETTKRQRLIRKYRHHVR